jgi:hypothetical protein
MPALPRLSVDLLHNVGAAVLPAVARLEVWCLVCRACSLTAAWLTVATVALPAQTLRGMRGSGSDAKPGDGDDKDL